MKLDTGQGSGDYTVLVGSGDRNNVFEGSMNCCWDSDIAQQLKMKEEKKKESPVIL